MLPEKSTSVVSPTRKSALKCLDKCDQKLYPNIYALFQIVTTIPVSTATPERTFSSLRTLKNNLRDTSESRLYNLALMNIHYRIEIDANEIVDTFNKTNRRLIL